MQQALDSTPDIDADSKVRMMNFFRYFQVTSFSYIYILYCNIKFYYTLCLSLSVFFRHTAFFLVAGDELKNQSQPPPCKHGSSNQLPCKNF
jgi:hypothetical protein